MPKCDNCDGEGFTDRRCGICGSGECQYCRDHGCVRFEVRHFGRPNTFTGDLQFVLCGLWIRAGDYVGEYKGFLHCSECIDELVKRDVPRDTFQYGRSESCNVCGYLGSVRQIVNNEKRRALANLQGLNKRAGR